MTSPGIVMQVFLGALVTAILVFSVDYGFSELLIAVLFPVFIVVWTMTLLKARRHGSVPGSLKFIAGLRGREEALFWGWVFNVLMLLGFINLLLTVLHT